MNLESKRPSGPLFRAGRDDDAWAIPDGAYAKEDGTFGIRFDDPMRVCGSPANSAQGMARVFDAAAIASNLQKSRLCTNPPLSLSGTQMLPVIPASRSRLLF